MIRGITQEEAREERLFRSLRRTLRRTDANGDRIFSDEDIRHVLPMFLVPVLTEKMFADLPRETQIMLGEFALLAGIPPGTDPKIAQKNVQEYYRRFPPNPTLVEEINQFLRQLSTSEQTGAAAKAMARALGQQLNPSTPKGLSKPKNVLGVGMRNRR